MRMNYFGHGYRYVDDPYFLAGTAVPDWLSVINRRVRARRASGPSPGRRTPTRSVAAVAAGVVQHHRGRRLVSPHAGVCRAEPGTDRGHPRTAGRRPGISPQFSGAHPGRDPAGRGVDRARTSPGSIGTTRPWSRSIRWPVSQAIHRMTTGPVPTLAANDPAVLYRAVLV